MAFDITKRRATETATVKLKSGDGTYMKDDSGKFLAAVLYGPGSKVWHEAQAEMTRKRTERVKEAEGNITAALEGGDADQNEFLAAVTVEWIGWEYPCPDKKGWESSREMFVTAYSDRALGYIRDQLWSEVNSWGSFMKGGSQKG